jgi:hypothetical protein
MPAETAIDRRGGAFLRSRREEGREPGWDARIGELARGQYGVSRRQLMELGLGKDAIQHRLGSGRLYAVYAGAYSVGHRFIPREGRWLAAVFASGDGAVLSHRSAASHWRIRPSSRSVIDVTTPTKSRS